VRPIQESACLESFNKDIHHHEFPCISMRLKFVWLQDLIFQSFHEAEIPHLEIVFHGFQHGWFIEHCHRNTIDDLDMAESSPSYMKRG
jgi:hypothetical protein